MADENSAPVFQIQRVYLKDLSLEQPHAPQILLNQTQPSVEIQLGLSAEPVTDGISDVCTRAGFPPVLLTEVNFQAMFEAQQAQEAQDAQQAPTSVTNGSGNALA